MNNEPMNSTTNLVELEIITNQIQDKTRCTSIRKKLVFLEVDCYEIENETCYEIMFDVEKNS